MSDSYDPGFKHGDPARIPRVLDELGKTWEGQPDLPLATLLGVLANRGVGWGTPDNELVAALEEERMYHPPEIDRDEAGRASSHLLVETVSPDQRVSFSGANVVVRAARDRDRQPSVWVYESLRPTGPGRPLVVTDGAGIDHRLGIVTLVSAFDPAQAPELEGLKRPDIGNSAWLVEFNGGDRALITHRIHLWAVQGRSTHKTTHAWGQVVRCVVGEDFVFAPAGGGEDVFLGRVEKVVLVEA